MSRCLCVGFREGRQRLGGDVIGVVQKREGIRPSDEEAAEAVQTPGHGSGMPRVNLLLTSTSVLLT